LEDGKSIFSEISSELIIRFWISVPLTKIWIAVLSSIFTSFYHRYKIWI
jgi:hypothetical protein